jgi:hypothetical protein
MIVWAILGAIGLALSLLYGGIITLPTTGLFVDIPTKIAPAFSQMGDPFIIMTWTAIALLSIVIIMKVGHNG